MIDKGSSSANDRNMKISSDTGIKDTGVSQLYEILIGYYNFDELWDLAGKLAIDLDTLPGDNKNSKAIELLAFARRHGRLSDLANILQNTKPQFFTEDKSGLTIQTSADQVTNLNLELSNLRQQLTELQNLPKDSQIGNRIEDILKIANRAVGRSEELSARIILPPQEITDVYLIPAHSLDHLEEYRSDESFIYLLIGVFSGATLGILSNWATTEPFFITRFSIILLAILLVLTLACILWAWRLHKRTIALKDRLLNHRLFSEHTDS
ncbi:MAG TPA: hypothetical protein VFQ23_20475 [Anaerolineales bacterium]|nr:hypothetical protein [Anaerolineales bacterium]